MHFRIMVSFCVSAMLLMGEVVRGESHAAERVVAMAENWIGKQLTREQAQSVIRGPYALTVRVVARDSGNPIPEFTVRQWVTFPVGIPADAIDSKEIADPTGMCRLENLAGMILNIGIMAKGYETQSRQVKVQTNSGEIKFAMIPGGTITGRIVDAEGKPVEGVRLWFKWPDWTNERHAGIKHAATTEANGEFKITGLPADVYDLQFPNAGQSMHSNMGEVNLQTDAVMRRQGSKMDWETIRRLREEKLNRSFPLPPQLPPIELKTYEIKDLGTIRIETAPMLDLKIYENGAKPLPNFSFQVIAAKDGRFVDQASGLTDEAGSARIPLTSWRPGVEMAVVAPRTQLGYDDENTIPLRIPEFAEKRREAEKKQTLREYYEMDWGEEGELPTRKFEDLSPATLLSIERARNESNELIRQGGANEALPAFQNYVTFLPEAGKVSHVRLDYKPTTDTLDLIFVFRDKETKLPIPRVRGAISETRVHIKSFFDLGFDRFRGSWGDEGRIFDSTDALGVVLVPALKPSGSFEVDWRHYSELRRDPWANRQKLNMAKKRSTWLVAVDAPGYVRRIFEVGHERVIAGKEIVFELEPEARVRGRVVLAATGEALSTTAMTAIARKQLGIQPFPYSYGGEVVLTVRDIDPQDRFYGESNFHAVCRMAIDPEGNFEMEGLKPGKQWVLNVQTSQLMPTVTRPIVLRAGMNDLGVIEVGEAGMLRGRITDGMGEGIAGVGIHLFESSIRPQQGNITTTGGLYQVSLRSAEADQTILRLTPPWGNFKTNTTTRTAISELGFDRTLTLDRTAATTISTRLERGNTLWIKVPPSPARDEAFRFYSQPSAWLEIRTATDDMRFIPSDVALAARVPNDDGLVYYQTFSSSDVALPASTETLVLKVDHVPPGPIGIRLNGAVIGDRSGFPIGSLPFRPSVFETLSTFAYGETEMPATSHTCTVDVNLVQLEFELVGRPALASMGDDGPMILLDRMEPISTFHGGQYQRMATRAGPWPKSSAEYETGMVGVHSFFVDFEPGPDGMMAYLYKPAIFRFVPAGTYRLRAFAQLADAMVLPQKAYREMIIDVPQGRGIMKFEIPWQGAEPRAEELAEL